MKKCADYGTKITRDITYIRLYLMYLHFSQETQQDLRHLHSAIIHTDLYVLYNIIYVFFLSYIQMRTYSYIAVTVPWLLYKI